MAEHNELGKAGETAAANYLIDQGYTILERNWRFQKDEIDIIAQKGNLLVVAEVKTRSSNYIEEPEAAVTRKKQKSIIKAANQYVCEKELVVDVQFDVISLIFAGSNFTLEHIPDAFYPVVK